MKRSATMALGALLLFTSCAQNPRTCDVGIAEPGLMDIAMSASQGPFSDTPGALVGTGMRDIEFDVANSDALRAPSKARVAALPPPPKKVPPPTVPPSPR